MDATGTQPDGGPRLDARFVEDALGDLLRERGGGEVAFRRAVIDSRHAEPGDLFVALRGERTDGHAHVADAVARGASGVLLAEPLPDLPPELARFLVSDTLAALQRLGARWRTALANTEVIGITGNVGKTTTKMITASLLAPRYRVAATPLNYNNEIGVPLCLLELTPDVERAVIEHGMYTTGEIALLCEWTRPRIGAVLNVGPVHLERAGSMEAIARAKRELVEALPAGGEAVLNADDPVVDAMAPHTAAHVLRFGTAAGADVRGAAVEGRGAQGFAFDLHAQGQSARVRCPLPGRHLLHNVLAAAAIALADGLPFDEVCAGIERLDVPLRLTVRSLPGGITLLDDTYNASPAATLAALDLLGETPGRRLALLGDMRELGPLSASLHREVGERAGEAVELLFTIGEEARGIAEAARGVGHAEVRHCADHAEAERALLETLRAGDALLVKGSRALALETVVAALEAALAEREDAR